MLAFYAGISDGVSNTIFPDVEPSSEKKKRKRLMV